MLVIEPGDSLRAIVARVARPEVTVESLQLENHILDPDLIDAGASLDICVGNGIDDITGAPWTPPVAPGGSGVAAQQQKLNELFAGTRFPELDVDGQLGRYTRRALCAARLVLGLPVTREPMEPGGPEEQALLAAGPLPLPAGAPVHAARWALIDQTCQVMFVGLGSERVVFVLPVSTGQEEFPTRLQDAAAVFRYDPATDNGGWHDSTVYPAGDDNPLNGNMYKPLYFDRGQAIHGANTVPTYPASHGCARLRVADQDALLAFLGLDGVRTQLWDAARRIDLTVTIQGRY